LTDGRGAADQSARKRFGLWLFGARGGLATTAVLGARALARGLTEPIGLVTETAPCSALALRTLGDVVFGGHEVRSVSLREAAGEVHRLSRTIPSALIEAIHDEFDELDADVRPGTLTNAGATIERITADQLDPIAAADESLRATCDRLSADLVAFRERHDLDGVVCVLVTSTEPQLRFDQRHATLEALDRAIDADERDAVRPSLLYAYAAAEAGCPLVHFTPSNAAFAPAIREKLDRAAVPYVGSDGKTGETLVKSALAPMFRHRALKVLSWQGYNMLGDRDGAVLAADDNKRAKIESKDSLLANILGYPLHTHVGIDYVPSLDDLKTAWDFIHFEGFLGHRMTMQFTWQGADAILAAPLVLDLARLIEFAHRSGEKGPQHQLACFFKRPIDGGPHDLHMQMQALWDWVAQHAS
jgi:myo-inositol-1-phosphate synthase